MKLLWYDKADYKLLEVLDEIISRGKHKSFRRLFEPSLHPRGIKELAAPQEVRIVYAMLKVLESVEMDEAGVEQRLAALKSLRDEVLDGNSSSLRNNTARVLLQTMKLLIRSDASEQQRLRLAHELRMALIGQPRFIRRQLKKFHLLEMPEEWDQLTFDDHVHDAASKGRKTPTHLIMDAWIKGIRKLQVIYYYDVPLSAARELLEAAEIMGLEVRIGVEMASVRRGRFMSLIWAPRGFASAEHFLKFFSKKEVKAFFDISRKAAEWKHEKVIEHLAIFNKKSRNELNKRYGVNLSAFKNDDFLKFVGAGQASLLHLAEFIAGEYTRVLEDKSCSGEEEHLELPTPEFINDNFIDHSAVNLPPDKLKDLPEIMRMNLDELSAALCELPSGNRLTLNLSSCGLADVIEAVYVCKGRISHLEIFNLKDYKHGGTDDIPAINRFRLALNQGNIIQLKRIIREILSKLENSSGSKNAGQADIFKKILLDIPALVDFYARSPLAVRIGSDSTGRYTTLHGMGLVVIDSLPAGMRRRIRKGRDCNREVIPVEASVSCYNRIAGRETRIGWLNSLFSLSRTLGGLFGIGYSKSREWRMDDPAHRIGGLGNIATLGGFSDEHIEPDKPKEGFDSLIEMWNCLNSNLKITLKVLIGLIPAFLSFYFTKDWWVLAYGGAFIWFGITGGRNVIQAVLGGGGLKRSDLLKWNDFISWQRIADSLLYTGISVPLLDVVIKSWMLQNWMGLDAETSPIMVYTAINVANGLYISTHNWFRGLPKTAIYGNFFRAALAIPLSILLSWCVSKGLILAGVTGIAVIMQQWAAIISKLASDCVAGLIEGYADRMKNIALRLRDYRTKITRLFSVYSKLELLFPEDDVSELMKSTKRMMRAVAEREQSLEYQLIINALDLLYFRMYQPQATNAFGITLKDMTQDECDILVSSQGVLEREKEISQMFIDGLVGKNFSKALSFYLDYHKKYLAELEKQSSTNCE